MIILALDTSAAASAALIDTESEDVLASWTEFSARRHAELLGPALVELLVGQPAPDRVVVGVGPGPFTGLRAGIATGIGFGLGRGIPVDGVPSHHALALHAYRQPSDRQTSDRQGAGGPNASGPGEAGPMLVATDARRKEVYWTRYAGLDATGAPEVTAGPHVSVPADVPAGRDDELRYGRGFALYPEVLGEPMARAPRDYPVEDPEAAECDDAVEDLEPSAADLGIVAARLLASGRELLSTAPLYLREPDAQPTAQRSTKLQ